MGENKQTKTKNTRRFDRDVFVGEGEKKERKKEKKERKKERKKLKNYK